MHRIGMMQGRLLPKVDGRIQAFPRGRWEEEFPLLQLLGYDAIELTIEEASWDIHPLRNESGRARLKELSEQHGVFLVGICGDNFMEAPLVNESAAIRMKSLSALLDLLENASALGLAMVEVPMMGRNSLRTEEGLRHFDAVMEKALPHAQAVGIDILLEADLPPSALARLMGAFDHPRLGINYDMGNSTWFGFDPGEELPLYHWHIRNVHVKDCKPRDYSVPLGMGQTQLQRVFKILNQYRYRGDFILQAARQEDDIKAAQAYLACTRSLLAEARSLELPR